MRYRTKLRVGFLATSLSVNIISLAILYTLSHRFLMDEFRNKVLSTAQTTATLIDGDLHDRIQSRADEGSAEFRKIRAQLRAVRDSNRSAGNPVKYIYTLRARPGTKADLVYVVDPEEDAKEHAHVGDPFGYPGEKLWTDRAYVEQEIFTDKTGSWLSGYAPIFDSAGKRIALVEVDIEADKVAADLRPVGIAAVGSVIVSLFLGLGVTFWLSSRVTQPLVALRDTLARIGRGDLNARSENHDDDEFGEVATTINQMVDGLREREMVKSAFARYVSQQVMDNILETGSVPGLHGDRIRITALFSDIRGFTTISETMKPEDVVEMLNEYFKLMVDVVFRNKGTLDKFMGDGLMVIFGAPASDPAHEEHAVAAALEMQHELHGLCERWASSGKPAIRIGIGINSGDAIVGNIGSESRMEYTAIGDTVNTAARLESATKEYGVDILISESTYDAVHGLFETRSIGPVHVKGRAAPVMTYSVTVS